MIILDEDDDPQQPKQLSDPSQPVVRASTPTPSLPDYEASQAQHNRWWPNRSKARFRRAALYALVIYFVLTVVIGVPVIVVKLRHKLYKHQNIPPPISPSSSSSLIVVDSETPLFQSSAVECNAWIGPGYDDSGLMRSDLQYTIPLDGTVFLQSNLSYQTAGAELQEVSGTLLVDINEDPTVTDALVAVSMRYSDIGIKNKTSVCLMNVSGSSNGLYIYAPHNLTSPETLIFNITLLFPQSPSLFVSEFVTMLPHFNQHYAFISPRVTFGEVDIGGPMSTVIVDFLTASTITVKSALAPVSGTFNASNSLVLDTVSAPISANISLYNSGAFRQVTFLELNTGNCPLVANVTLFLSPTAPPAVKAPNFIAKAETFNAPLTFDVQHDVSSPPSVIHLRAENNLGEALVSVDNKFAGTFDVSTTFAEASVTLRDANSTQPADLAAMSASSAASSTPSARSLEFDVISGSSLTGWVGTGKRPPVSFKHPFGREGRVEVVSSLSAVTLLLGS
ncbi:hypothetical protein BKA93DRAFT_721858 [Sparassis latifolia]